MECARERGGGTICDSAALFAILRGPRIKTKSVRELLATQLDALPECENVLWGGIVDNVARSQLWEGSDSVPSVAWWSEP